MRINVLQDLTLQEAHRQAFLLIYVLQDFCLSKQHNQIVEDHLDELLFYSQGLAQDDHVLIFDVFIKNTNAPRHPKMKYQRSFLTIDQDILPSSNDFLDVRMN